MEIFHIALLVISLEMTSGSHKPYSPPRSPWLSPTPAGFSYPLSNLTLNSYLKNAFVCGPILTWDKSLMSNITIFFQLASAPKASKGSVFEGTKRD